MADNRKEHPAAGIACLDLVENIADALLYVNDRLKQVYVISSQYKIAVDPEKIEQADFQLRKLIDALDESLILTERQKKEGVQLGNQRDNAHNN